MHWTGETGFGHSQKCLNYVVNQIQVANQELSKSNQLLDLQIVDACVVNKNNNQLLVTNSWIDPTKLDKKNYEQFADSWYGMYSGSPNVGQIMPIKKFNCFINRMDVLRQSWLYQLVRSNIFDQGFISFNMDISRHIMLNQWPVGSTPMQIFESQYQQHLQIFQKEHDIVLPMVPYRNFDNALDLNQIIMQTEFSIVLETHFERNDVITFSEKIFRCLKLPRPWILYAMKGAVEYLRNLGFDVLDDIIDHSYDQVVFCIDRQRALLNLAESLCKQNLTSEQINRCKQAAQHNQKRLEQMFESWYNDIDISIKNAKNKCLI